MTIDTYEIGRAFSEVSESIKQATESLLAGQTTAAAIHVMRAEAGLHRCKSFGLYQALEVARLYKDPTI